MQRAGELTRLWLTQAETYTKTQGLVFVGLHVGNELLEDIAIPRAMIKVADALRKEFPQTLVLVVSSRLPIELQNQADALTVQLDNQKLATTEPALIVRFVEHLALAQADRSSGSLTSPPLPPHGSRPHYHQQPSPSPTLPSPPKPSTRFALAVTPLSAISTSTSRMSRSTG